MIEAMLWQIMAPKVVSSKVTYDLQATWHGVRAADGEIDLGYCRPRLRGHAKSATVHQRPLISVFRITETAVPRLAPSCLCLTTPHPGGLAILGEFVIPGEISPANQSAV